MTGSPTAWSISSGGSNVTGTFIINNLPAPASTQAGQVYWYQLVFSDGNGDQKVFDFYATATNNTGQVDTSAGSLAADGNASIQAISATQLQLNLNPATSMPIGLLAFEYNSQFSSQPAAPVAGITGANGFVAIDQQNGTGLKASLDGKVPASDAPTITLHKAEYLQFGWTGTNNGKHTGTPTNPVGNTVGLISEYTNKINAGNLARINFYDSSTNSKFSYFMEATADLDGQWLTTSSVQLGNGTYQVTMTETLPDGTPFGPASYPLTIKVEIPGGSAASVNAGPAAWSPSCCNPTNSVLNINTFAKSSNLEHRKCGALNLLIVQIYIKNLIKKILGRIINSL